MPLSSAQITVYPANRLEDLAVLLEHVLSLNPGLTLARSTVIVESKGMQHWVSMALAESRGLCMNVDFPMPGVFLWQLVRRVLGPERVPLESPYQREALAWRIDRLLASPECCDDPRFAEVTRYWRRSVDDGPATTEPLKRYQLAAKQADLFEQYLLFRPDWITAWEQGAQPEGLGDSWQGALWRALVQENPDHPVRLQQEAIAALAGQRDKLPPQVCLFAINTLPPSTLQFFDQLARYTQVHLFHLNPCVAYWGDLQSEKQLAAQRAEQARRWLALRDPEQPELPPDDATASHGDIGNPLLANLGGQGKEFFALLQGLDTCEISAFELPQPDIEEQGTGPTVLQQLQRDILTLQDARPADPARKAAPHIDDSITISASHSALRELQALHDWLLHRFNADPTLTPRDVLVMCPQVEQYAPYISAVFDSGYGSARFDGEERDLPRLPVSITDRAPKDAEPLVSSFLELLTLPDSRFQVSKVLDLLRLPSLQQRFGFGSEELATLEWWLRDACVHWGLDGAHKAQLLGGSASELFSWSWGLRRLLLGFARGDRAELVEGDWLLPHVEGSDALLLGRLMQLLERLQRHARQLAQPRTPEAWGQYLRELRDAFFASGRDGGRGVDEGEAAEVLDQAINQLVNWTDRVGYTEPLSLEVVRYYLNHHLAIPDGSNRFMTGQITFCSLEPMRSAPFRVIAILGLNDGEYPRQQVPFGFDLMADTPRRFGDRSRRGDDRYLFLEALVCTRERLYLSYQGASITNNSERQPSLILTELMDYLARGYGWNFDPAAPEGQLRRQPLHPFSRVAFEGPAPSFDRRWLALSTPGDTRDNRIQLPAPEPNGEQLPELALEALVRFFDNPARAFAEQRLGLSLYDDSAPLEDAEPFDADGLAAFQGRDRLLDAYLSDAPETTVAAVREMLQVSGHLPDSRRAEVTLDHWDRAAAVLAEAVDGLRGQAVSRDTVTLVLDGVCLTAELPLLATEAGAQLLLWRAAKCKSKDKLRLWLYHLMAEASGTASRSRGLFLGEDRERQPIVESLELGPQGDAVARAHLSALLDVWRQGLCQPLLLNADLGFAICAAGFKKGKDGYQPLPDPAGERQKAWDKAWDDGAFANAYGAGRDPYVRWFWPDGETLDACWPPLQAVYAPATHALLGIAAGEGEA